MIHNVIAVLILVLLSPLLYYLRDQTYRNTHGRSTIKEDVRELVEDFKEWRRRRKERKEYKQRFNKK